MEPTRRRRPRAAVLLAGTALVAVAGFAFPVPGTFASANGQGQVHAVGAVEAHGGPGDTGTPVVAVVAAPGDTGYWVALAHGGVHTFGSAPFHGAATDPHRPSPVVDLAPTPTGDGYWLATAAGDVFAFGDADEHGGLDGARLNEPIVAVAPTRTGEGYWLVASDGGVFSFGDARYLGGAANEQRRTPIVDAAADRTGEGYWLVSAGGDVYTFGSATPMGAPSASGAPAAPVVGISAARDGRGYWVGLADGGVRAFGTARDHGALVGAPAPVVDLAVPASGDGYWLLTGSKAKTVSARQTGGAVEYQAAAVAPGEPPDSDFDRLARCESTSRWHLNTGNGYYGGLQFSAATWRGLGGPGMPHENSREVQIEVARRQWRQSGWRAWPHCSRAVGLR